YMNINSSGNELFPNLTTDNVLYYSSDGFAGMGGLDVFHATGSRNQWSVPRNMRYPVNSSGDDFAYVLTYDGEQGVGGYLSSNRKGGKGGDDIYSFTYQQPKIVIVLKGTTANKHTREILAGTSVTLYDGSRGIVAKQISDNEGEFVFV